ncbi:MAG: bifunctional DNA-formamidopyrimidine glycosylase/DNA-(apurinic or apyrimidinic site) lyase [Planctomycetota bacterium]|nr:bifunctional DNA-formamidopyrimidine glycosylase/DNA-(apurinic or apyrimidinic site) lyase [Planctomycetota bacterium]MDA1210954.1 bifunctional DNA-formamidopyrimidine glycosylase/DNA-(apurinic or apyrimidinic site) lyase [Planctomycetota bacterium]
MPELPEVETMVRGIAPVVTGRVVRSAKPCRCRYRPLSIVPSPSVIARRTKGTTLVSVYRRAKRVVLELSSGDRFVIEPRMTGLMLLSDPPDREHLRFEWRFEDGEDYTGLWFWDRRGLGTIRLFDRDEFERSLGSHKLGPDALLMTVEDWKKIGERTRRPIKVALLDQKLVAGIGNLYASEILHLANVNPQTSASSLTARQLKRLRESTQTVLETAIRYEGSTLGDGTYRNALNQAGQYQNAHKVYDRADEVCMTCHEGTIIRMVQAQRSTFYCPVCQPGRTLSPTRSGRGLG